MKSKRFPKTTDANRVGGREFVRRFSRDDKSSLAHALDHLLANKIAEADCRHSGWYCGNREQFVARHKKAIALMRTLLSPNNRIGDVEK